MTEILYSLIAAEDTLLIEANKQTSSSKYVRACRKILKKIARRELRRPDGMATLLSGSYAYNYIHGCEPDNYTSTLESLIFLCVTEALPYAATPSETREAAFTYLTSIRRSFLEQFRGDLDVLCKNNSSLKANNNNNNNNTDINNISDDASDSNMILNIDGQMKSDLRRFAGYMRDEMDAFSARQKNAHEEEEEDDDDDLNAENKDNDEKKYDDNNNAFDLRRGPPPPGHPLYQPSKVDRVVNQIDTLKDNVKQAIEMVIDRGEEISLLQGKADEFSKESTSFRNRSRRVQYQYCRELYKQRCIIVFVAIFTIYLFSAWICGWSWDSCGN